MRRKRARYLFAESIVRYHCDSLGEAWMLWMEMAIAKAHLALIQRVARGFLARCESNFVRDMHWYAAKIQSQVRFKIAYKKFWVLLQRRIW